MYVEIYCQVTEIFIKTSINVRKNGESSFVYEVCACACPLSGINMYVATHNNWLNKFYSFSALNMTLAFDKIGGCGLINKVHQ